MEAKQFDCEFLHWILPADGNYYRYRVISEERNLRMHFEDGSDETIEIEATLDFWRKEVHPEAKAIEDFAS